MDPNDTLIKIVHGSVVPWRSRRSQIKWMYKLGDFLKTKELNASYFVWSGWPWDAFSKRTIEKLLQNLLEESKNSKKLCIFAKSLGAEIVERALDLAAEKNIKLSCDVFIRIASPDAKSHSWVKKIIDINVDRDILDRLGTILARIIFKDRKEKTDSILEINLGKLNHKQLNQNITILEGKHKNKSLYDLYYELIDNF